MQYPQIPEFIVQLDSHLFWKWTLHWFARGGLFPRATKTGCRSWERQSVFKIRSVTAPRTDFHTTYVL